MNPQYIKTTLLYNSYNTRARVFSVNFFSTPIHTTVTSTPAVARQWIYNTRRNYAHSISSSSLVVGLGVQWNHPLTKGGNSPSAATLQLCIDTNCLIFQLCFPTSAPATLRRFLADDRITFVGVNNGRDKKILDNSRLNLEVSNLVDLAKGIPMNNRKYWSMEKMASYYMGFNDVVKPKKLGLSNWEEFWLSNDQVQYACVDAYVSFTLATQSFGLPKLNNNNGGRSNNKINSDKPEFKWFSDDEDNDTVVVEARPNFTWLSEDDDDNGAVVINARPAFTWYSSDDDNDANGNEDKPDFFNYLNYYEDSVNCDDFRSSREEFDVLNNYG